MAQASTWLEQQMHPTVIISAFRQALEDLVEILRDNISTQVDITNKAEMLKIIKTCIGTKFIKKWSVCIHLSVVGFLLPNVGCSILLVLIPNATI